MKQNQFIKMKLKEQFLKPITLCHVKGKYCRFHIPGYCLEEYRPYGCEYMTITKGGKNE